MPRHSAPRVTGGRLTGRPLSGGVPRGVRPTAARVREALGSILSEELKGARVLDAFAGAGTLTCEAISRGASRAVAVERSRGAYEALVRSLRIGALTPLGGIVIVAATAGALVSLRWFFRPGRELPLPVCGLWPLDVGLVVALMPSYLDMFGVALPSDLLVDLAPGSPLYLEILMTAVLLWVIPAATIFHWRRRAELWGPRRKQWLRALGGSAAFLIALILLDHLAWDQSVGLAWPGTLVLLSLYVLGMDWWDELTAWRRAPAEAPLRLLEQHQDPVDALEALEARRRADPDGYYVLTGLRYRSVTWFFAPFVPLLVLGVEGSREGARSA